MPAKCSNFSFNWVLNVFFTSEKRLIASPMKRISTLKDCVIGNHVVGRYAKTALWSKHIETMKDGQAAEDNDSLSFISSQNYSTIYSIQS